MLQVKAGNGQIAEAVALKEGVSFVARPGSPQLLAAVRVRQHFLGPQDPKSPRKDTNASQRGASVETEDAESATSQASPTAASRALVDRRGISANMADSADASEVTLNRNVLRAYLAVEMVLGVQQAVRQNLDGTAKVVAKPAPKAQSSFTSVEITETTATQPGKVSAIATGAPAKSSTLAVAMPGPADREAGLSAQHHEGLAVAEEIEAEFTRAQKAAHLTVRKAFNFTMQGSWRLLWLALMGDTSFWQEAMHLVDGSRGRKFLRYCAFPLMVLLQAIASLSQVWFSLLTHIVLLAAYGVDVDVMHSPCPSHLNLCDCFVQRWYVKQYRGACCLRHLQWFLNTASAGYLLSCILSESTLYCR